jgi:hypothetical protein
MKQTHTDKYNKLKQIDTQKASLEILQKRGTEFEKLFNDIFEDEKILLRKSYYTSDNRSEQIDGAVEVYNRVFLIEIKWVESGLAASELYAFIGKTENKFSGTLGIFISKEKFSENFLNSLNKGRRQSIIVIHGEDIDFIFDNNVILKDYIEFTFKQLSFDNRIHFPVERYLKIVDTKPLATPVVSTTLKQNVVQFISNNLLKVETPAIQLQLLMTAQTQEEKDLTFNYVIKNYSTVFYNSLLNRSDTKLFAISNFNSFIDLYEFEDDKNIIKNAEQYYSKLVETSLEIYSRELFIKLFSKYYAKINQTAKDKFEAFILLKWSKFYDVYDTENQLTDIVKPIWGQLKDDTVKTLSEYYLNIFIRDTKDKFSQKAFANHLLNNKIIPKNSIEDWLNKRVKESIASYKTLSEDSISFIAYTYLPIARHLEIENEKWVEHINQIIKNIS